MSDFEDLHQDFNVKVTMGQFKRFLVSAGRSPGCPVCSNPGMWNFYVDKSEGAGDHALMALTPMQSQYHGSPDDTSYLLVMDCTNCGYISQTSSMAVVKWLAAKGISE